VEAVARLHKDAALQIAARFWRRAYRGGAAARALERRNRLS